MEDAPVLGVFQIDSSVDLDGHQRERQNLLAVPVLRGSKPNFAVQDGNQVVFWLVVVGRK